MQENLHFEIIINAKVMKVWDTMLTKDTYEQWVKVFDPNSTYEGSWDKGSEIKFLSASSGQGMLAVIAENTPYKFISILHKGEIGDNGEKKYDQEAYENYSFEETESGGTKLMIDLIGLPTEYKPMFEAMWPNALAKLKELSESA